jgi:hypothetical protein
MQDRCDDVTASDACVDGKRMGNYRIDPTRLGLPFLNSAAVDPSEPAPI